MSKNTKIVLGIGAAVVLFLAVALWPMKEQLALTTKYPDESIKFEQMVQWPGDPASNMSSAQVMNYCDGAGGWWLNIIAIGIEYPHIAEEDMVKIIKVYTGFNPDTASAQSERLVRKLAEADLGSAIMLIGVEIAALSILGTCIEFFE